MKTIDFKKQLENKLKYEYLQIHCEYPAKDKLDYFKKYETSFMDIYRLGYLFESKAHLDYEVVKQFRKDIKVGKKNLTYLLNKLKEYDDYWVETRKAVALYDKGCFKGILFIHYDLIY